MNTIEFKEHNFYNAKTGENKPRSGSQELSMSWGSVSTKKELKSM
jgi:predicted metal-dependent hydrolase